MSDNPASKAAASLQNTIFADSITDVLVANGVARLTLAMAGADGKPAPVATLCVPVMQLPALANGLGNLMQQLQERARTAQQTQSQQRAAAPDNIATADAAFRFNA